MRRKESRKNFLFGRKGGIIFIGKIVIPVVVFLSGGLRMVVINELVGALIQLAVISLIPLCVWFLTARKKESFLRWIGLKKVQCSKPLTVIVLSAAVAVIYFFLISVSMRELPEGVTLAGSRFAGMGVMAFPAALIYGFIRTGLSEEIFFRGFLLKRFQTVWGFGIANLLQALLFGLMHGVPFGIATQSAWSLIILTVLPGAIGWYQGWLNEKQGKGSIVPSWLMHGFMNFLSTCLNL